MEDAAAFVATSRRAYLRRVSRRFPVPTRCPYLLTVRLVCASYSPSRLPYLSRKTCFEPVVEFRRSCFCTCPAEPRRLPSLCTPTCPALPERFRRRRGGSLLRQTVAAERRDATICDTDDGLIPPASLATSRTPLPIARNFLAFSILAIGIGGRPKRSTNCGLLPVRAEFGPAGSGADAAPSSP